MHVILCSSRNIKRSNEHNIVCVTANDQNMSTYILHDYKLQHYTTLCNKLVKQCFNTARLYTALQ